MPDRGHRKTKTTIRRTLHRGVCWFTSVLALSVLLTACGGGGEEIQPPLTSAASLSGAVTFSANVPLGTPPADAFDGSPPPDIRYGARIVDPGDDIGGKPLPRPSTLVADGGFEFEKLDPDPSAYFNLRFTVEAGLEAEHSLRTPVSFNVPIALVRAFKSMLACSIDRPSEYVLQLTYAYRGPDGSREVRLRVDFATDLITFDLDGDGQYDDLVAVDTNHDAIPDEQAPLMVGLDYTTSQVSMGTVSGVGSNTISIGGSIYQIWGNTNLMNPVSGNPLALSQVTVGRNATVSFTPFSQVNVAVRVEVQPSPSDPQDKFEVSRDGAIEEITATTISVGNVMFRDYASANIRDVLDNKVSPSELEVGMYVTAKGVLGDDGITATEIIVKEVSPPPAIVERQGSIEALVPEDNPTMMKVSGIEFQLTLQTVIRDLTGKAVDTSYLIVGNPVHVVAHESEGLFIADLVELQYKIAQIVEVPEVVVLIDDPLAVADVEAAVEQLQTQVAVAPVVISSYPPAFTAPECIQDVFEELFWSAYILKGLPGFIEAFPRVEDGDCSVLVLLEDGFPGTQAWIDFFFPNGIGGAALQYDIAVRPPIYGAGPEMIEAMEVGEELMELLKSNESVVYVYTSPDTTFSGD